MATEEDEVGTGAIGTMVAVLALAVVVIGLGVTALVRTEQSALSASRETGANLRPIRELRAVQLAELNGGPAWLDKAKGSISLPITRAMELVVDEVRSQQQAATNVDQAQSNPRPADSASAPTSGDSAGGPSVSASTKPESSSLVPAAQRPTPGTSASVIAPNDPRHAP